ncbi:hypothetical protein [Albimonas pacifica]|uniref:Uncharacterized protein n=1 Tax=Albimonas pacifica TaxID=1114924 RepID=A0A1I3C024_9RHOB|nr:hypothetical protein [Albimonas pacifica]SFH67958.1 hypothetical protein SAMN05216258_101477 [Albimonas pacifica]
MRQPSAIGRIVSSFLSFMGLVGAMATALGLAQAAFSDRLAPEVSLTGSPCDPGEAVLSRWERALDANVGRFVYLDVALQETPECEDGSIGEHPFYRETAAGAAHYTLPLRQPRAANSMPRVRLPVSEAAEALLADGFLDFENEGALVGEGVFFVDLLDDPHAGRTYRLAPAPYSVEAGAIHACSRAVHAAPGAASAAWAYLRECVAAF